MGMYDNLKDIVKVFRFDETLLRLLYYPPLDLTKGTKDPLDVTLPNVMEMDLEELWAIRDKRIMSTRKADDLEQEPLCRIYLYAGRRKPVNGGYVYANQQIIVDILCHMDFEKDLRSMRISDRIEELLVKQRVTGISKILYVDGGQINAPEDYVGYSHIFELTNMK